VQEDQRYGLTTVEMRLWGLSTQWAPAHAWRGAWLRVPAAQRPGQYGLILREYRAAAPVFIRTLIRAPICRGVNR
jgi:hypothetical protein